MRQKVFKWVACFAYLLAIAPIHAFPTVATPEPGDTLRRPCLPNPYPALCAAVCREYSKTIDREFNTSANGSTVILNRHGDVTVHSWQEKKVKIHVTVIVNANDQKDADRALNKININFTNTKDFVKAETVIAEVPSSSFSKLVAYTTDSYQDYRINYEVWIPIENQLNVYNKFGNTFIGQLNGKLTSDIAFGDIMVDQLRSDASLYLETGGATLANVQNLYGQLDNSHITVNNAATIQLETQKSQCTFRRANDIQLTSKYDDLSIGTVNNLRVQAKYSNLTNRSAKEVFLTTQFCNITISNLEQSIDAAIQNGSLLIGQVGKAFDSAKLDAHNASITLDFGRMPYRYKLNASYASLKLGDVLVQPHQKEVVKEGFVGNANAKGWVKAQLVNGNLLIR